MDRETAGAEDLVECMRSVAAAVAFVVGPSTTAGHADRAGRFG